MKLSLSVAAQDRRYSKAYSRVRTQIAALCKDFAEVEMTNPIHEVILIGVTDSKPSSHFEVVPNRDGFFQVLVGVGYSGDDEELKKQILSKISEAISACPFSKPDKEKFMSLLSEHGIPAEKKGHERKTGVRLI